MTTIYDELRAALESADPNPLWAPEQTEAVIAALGIDPDLPGTSIVVTERPKCPACEGTGWISPTGHGMSHGDEGDPCSTCDGTGYVPDEWATVDRCLGWLRVRGREAGMPQWNGDGYDVDVFEGFDGFDVKVSNVLGFTYHAALVAACRAVQDGEP